MPISPNQIDIWRQLASERQTLEFKEAKLSFPHDKLEAYCVAIANEGGGHLVLGVADQPPRPVVGTAAFTNLVKATQQLFDKLKFRVEIEEVQHANGRVLVFIIPPRPNGTAYNLEGKYLMRSGASLVPMSEDRLRVIFAEGDQEWLEKPSLIDLSAQDVIELLDTQTYFELIRQPYPTHRDGVIDRLNMARLIDRQADVYSIRRLGGLLLARKLDAFPDLARKAARVIVYNGGSKLETRLDQTGNRGYAVGFRGLVDFVMAQLPQNEVIENALRKEVKLLPEDTIRELLANALVHQDLHVTGAGPMVEIYSNRVEISNPGEPVVTVERFIDGYQSRNERLADMMRRMRICEEKGSGIDRVITAVELFQLPAPDFRVAYKRTVVVLYGHKPFDEMGRDDRVRSCYQHCALRWVMSEHLTNQSLRKRFGLGEDKAAIASQIISAAVDAGLIKPDETVGGSRKYARYAPFWA